MKRLNGLVKMLRPGEKRLLRNNYRANDNVERLLRLKLFNYIDSGQASTDKEAKVLLEANQSKSAYSHLKNRVREDILNILLLQESAKRIAQPNRAAVLECWKKLAQAYVLIFRGEKRESSKILKGAYKLADKYELFDEKIMISHVLRESFLTLYNADQLNALNDDLKSNSAIWLDMVRAEELSFFFTLPDIAIRSDIVRQPGFEVEVINELGHLYDRSRSSKIGFSYYMAYVEFCSGVGKYRDAIEAGIKFLKLVEDSPAVRSKNNIAGVNQTLGVTYMEIGEFVKAIDHLSRAEKLFPANGFNRLQCLEFMVQATVADAQYDKAMQLIDRAMSHPRISKREGLIPKWLYLRSCIEFLSGEVQESFKTLNMDPYLTRQLDEWNIQFKLLEIMQLIALKDEEWLDFKIDAMRKFLTRNKKLASPRVRAAVEIFGNLLRKDLDFDALSPKSVKLLEDGLTGQKGYEWKPAGPELVRYDLWVNSKRSSPS